MTLKKIFFLRLSPISITVPGRRELVLTPICLHCIRLHNQSTSNSGLPPSLPTGEARLSLTFLRLQSLQAASQQDQQKQKDIPVFEKNDHFGEFV